MRIKKNDKSLWCDVDAKEIFFASIGKNMSFFTMKIYVHKIK